MASMISLEVRELSSVVTGAVLHSAASSVGAMIVAASLTQTGKEGSLPAYVAYYVLEGVAWLFSFLLYPALQSLGKVC